VAANDGCCGASDGCCGDGFGCPPGDQPVVYSDQRPHPLSGGTLLITRDGYTAIASDPDRDRIVVVDLKSGAVTGTIATTAGGEPGRAIQDAAGYVHVLTRAAGEVVSFDPTKPGISATTNVCDAPRGIGYVAANDQLFVACAGGELVTLSSGSKPLIVKSSIIGRDLRDVVVSGGKIFVTHFRSTQLDVLDATGAVVKSTMPRGYTAQFQDQNGDFPTFTPAVAWRAIPRAGGGVFMIHQQAKSSPTSIPDDGGSTYGGFDCNSAITHSEVTAFDANGDVDQADGTGGLSSLPLPVDIAENSDGSRIALVGAANGMIVESTPESVVASDGCLQNFPLNAGGIDANGNTIDARMESGSVEPIVLA